MPRRDCCGVFLKERGKYEKYQTKNCHYTDRDPFAGGIYYYVTLPAINIHSTEFWIFLGVLILLIAALFAKRKGLNRYELKESKGMKVILGLFAAVVIVYLAGALLSSPVVNADKYQNLMTVETGEFTRDIEELSFDQIPLLDRDSATLLGNRGDGKHGGYGLSV